MYIYILLFEIAISNEILLFKEKIINEKLFFPNWYYKKFLNFCAVPCITYQMPLKKAMSVCKMMQLYFSPFIYQ